MKNFFIRIFILTALLVVSPNITLAAEPDLSLVDVTYTSEKLSFKITNAGAASFSGNVKETFQWLDENRDAIGSPNETYSGSFGVDVTGSNPQEFKRVNGNAAVAQYLWTNIPATARYLRVTIRPVSTATPDSNLENNEKVIERKLPDLIIGSVTFDPTLRYPIITIKNQGNASARNADGIGVNYVWLNESGGASGGDSFLTGNIDLPSNQTLLVGLREGQAPDDAASLPNYDSIRVRVLIDITDQVNESNEDNNIMEVDVPAADADNLTYPIAGLGNCQNREDCRVYCEQAANAEACAAFGVNSGLMTEEDAEAAEEIDKINEDNPGPGNCTTKESCAEFCEAPANIDACLNYAEQNNWMSADDLSKARKVVGVLQSGGATPGGCNTPGGCKTYCSDNTNAVECVAFGKSAGLLSAQEAAEAEKIAPLMQSGQMPGGGKTREETEEFCNKKENRAECDKFFEQAGVKKDGEKPEDESPEGEEPKDENAPLIFKEESGGPGGCKTKAECDAYCDSHPGECDEQVKQAGGEVKEVTVPCSTNQECKTFCADPANTEACKNVVIEESPEEAEASKPEVILAEIEKLRQNILEMPSQSQDCVKQAWGAEPFDKVMAGQAPETPVKAETLQSCYAEGVQKRDEEAAKKPEGQEERDAEAERTSNPSPSILESLGANVLKGVLGAPGTLIFLFDSIIGWFGK